MWTDEEIEQRRTELMQKSKEELVEIALKYYRIAEGIDSESWQWLCDIGSLYRVLRRDYQPITGILVRCNFEVASIELAVVDEKQDWKTKRTVTEWKIVRIKPGSVLYYEKLLDREEKEPEEEEETGGIVRY